MCELGLLMGQKHILFFYSVLILTGFSATAQPSRLSVEVNAGIPIMFASIPSTISTYGGIGVRYNITTALSAQLSANMGAMRGMQNQSANSFVFPERVSNYKSYTSQFYNYTLRGQLNLERVFNLRQFPLFYRLNPYLTGGVGFTAPLGDGWVAERYFGASTKTYKNGVEGVWTSQLGVVVRYYLNPMIDLNIGSEFNHCPTYYLDGIYPDNKYDHYLLSYIGANIKLGATHRKQHIEWVNVVIKERKPKRQPKDDPRPVDPQPLAEEPKSDSVVAINTDSAMAQEVVKTTDSVTTDVASTPIQQSAPTANTPSAQVIPAQQPAAASNVPTPKATKPVATAVQPRKGGKAPIPAPNTRTGSAQPAQTFSEPVVRVQAATDPNAPALNMIEGVANETPAKYTVIAAAYSKRKVKYAYMFRDRLRKQGYQAAVVQSDIDPNIVRVMVYSTNTKNVALSQCNKVRSEFEKSAWINVKKK